LVEEGGESGSFGVLHVRRVVSPVPTGRQSNILELSVLGRWRKVENGDVEIAPFPEQIA
jgi:hypothetical protein